MWFEQGSGAARIATSPPRSGVAISRPQQFCGERIDFVEQRVRYQSGFAGLWGALALLSFLGCEGRNEEVQCLFPH